MKYTPRLPKKNVNISEGSGLKELFILLGGLLALAVAGYFGLALAVDLVVPHIPVGMEHKLAAYLMKDLEMADPDPEAREAIQTLLDGMESECVKLPYDFTVHVHPKPIFNAVALPGGHILVFSGLLESVENENELAFVLAHELGHFDHRDHLRGLGRSVVFMTMAAAIFGGSGRVGQMVAGSVNLAELSFSRKQETRADEFALDTLNCYYGHIAGAKGFFEKMGTKQGKARRFGGHYLSTHPETQARITHLKDYARERGYAPGPSRPLPAALEGKAD